LSGWVGQVLTDDNLDELVGRAAYLTKAEVDHLVASVRPRISPRDGIRQIVGTGHLKRNELPGWQTLGYGYQRLIDAVAAASVLHGLDL